MKNLFIMSALIFVASQAITIPANAGAVRLLKAMPACKEFEQVQRVNEADKAADMAMKQGDSALTEIKNLDGICAQTAANSTYNSDAQITKLTSQSKVATKAATSAVVNLDTAFKQVSKVAPSLGAVGAPKECVKEANALPGKLTAQRVKVEGAMKKLESCVGRASVSTAVATGTASGISGVNPADHSKKPTSCMPGDGDCEDRANPFAQ